MGQQEIWQRILGMTGKKLAKMERKGKVRKDWWRRRRNKRKKNRKMGWRRQTREPMGSLWTIRRFLGTRNLEREVLSWVTPTITKEYDTDWNQTSKSQMLVIIIGTNKQNMYI